MHSRSKLSPAIAALLWSARAAPTLNAAASGVTTLEIKVPPNRIDDQYYTVDLDFDGQTHACLLDTGSADHFVATEECNNTDPASGCYNLESRYTFTGNEHIVQNETFFTIVGAGVAYGNQSLMDIGLGDITAKNIGTGLVAGAATDQFQNGSFSGLIGLGFLNVSRQYYFNKRLPLLDTMLKAGQLAKPLFSLSLPRLYDPDSSKTGLLTFGGIEAGRDNLDLTYHEVLPTLNANNENFEPDLQGWIVQMNMIRMNGKEIPVSALLDPQNRSLAMMDTGGQRIYVRPTELDAIAAAFNGPTDYQIGRDIYFDCSIPQSLELQFGDAWYPIHPLDLIIPGDHGSSNGTELCLAAIGSWTRTFGDAILGTPFFRSVFSVFDFVSNTPYSVSPRMGFASLVDPASALASYPSTYKQRLG